MTKKIKISQEAYDILDRERRPGESFSDVLLRLIERYQREELAKKQRSILDKEEFESLDKV